MAHYQAQSPILFVPLRQAFHHEHLQVFALKLSEPLHRSVDLMSGIDTL